MSGRTSFVSRNLALILLAGLLVIMGVSTALTVGSHRADLARQTKQVEGLEKRLQASRAREQKSREMSLVETTGVEVTRKNDDTVVITNLVKTAVTWRSGVQYDVARTSLQRRYGLPEGGQFLTTFLPPATYNQDSSGKRYYFIDSMAMGSRLADVKVHVISARGSTYRYAVAVDAEVTSSEISGASAVRRSLLLVTTEADGSVTDLEGHATVTETKKSDL